MVKREELPKLRTEEEAQNVLRVGTVLETHCKRCYANQGKGIYPYQSGLAGEVLDIATNLLVGCRLYEFNRGEKLLEKFLEICDNNSNCEEGVKTAKEISELAREIYRHNLNDKEENY